VRRRRREGEGFGLSFLDCICCGFGALVLLLVLTRVGEPTAIELATVDLEKLLVRLELELEQVRGETTVLNRELTSREEQLSREQEMLARLRGDLSEISGRHATTRELSEVQDLLEGRLLAARQELTQEMRRLQAQRPERPSTDAPVGGIPVDSEYVIFVIDTSGSMKGHAWPLVERKMEQVLDIYPRVKGIQVLNDMGQYMFSYYKGKWIPDTPGRRKAILERLRSWSAFSNSSPVEGIETAIRTFARGDRTISIYVLGDEFTGPSIDEVVDTVDSLNRRDRSGRPRVRIHGIGFPTVFTVPGAREHTGVRFATLMRTLCERNDGSFVALNTTRP
jgi:hypothetical protein